MATRGSLDITEREREGIGVLDLKGRVTAGSEVSTFRSAIEKYVSSRPDPKLVLNMQGVDYIDSTGLGALVMSSTVARKANGAVKLVHLNRRNIELLVMTKIDVMFEVFDDETEAVNSFFPGREIRKFDILAFVKQSQED